MFERTCTDCGGRRSFASERSYKISVAKASLFRCVGCQTRRNHSTMPYRWIDGTLYWCQLCPECSVETRYTDAGKCAVATKASRLCERCAATKTTKTCTRCNVEKAITEFWSDSQKQDQKSSVCKKCGKEYRDQHSERYQQHERKRQYQRKYGISMEEAIALAESQNYQCLLCDKVCTLFEGLKNDALVVDHDKHTGRIRGMLCSQCNVGIGFLLHDVKLLRRAVDYLS